MLARLVSMMALFSAAAPVWAVPPQVTVDHGIEFVTVGDPGNRPTDETLDAGPLGDIPSIWLAPGLRVGAVDYEYRMARTELTVGQWREFVNAYMPFYTGGRVNPSFSSTGLTIGFDGIPVLNGDYSLNDPATVSFEYAARYANWLCNDKINEAWAFESGAYDTSTFTKNADGSTNHQLAHTAGAKFWIPTEDEYVKAAYWDPEKDGVGGYWMYPHGRNRYPVPGPPESGGESNADVLFGEPSEVGSYPDQMSPWGLLDTSGGAAEMLETRQRATHDRIMVRGAEMFSTTSEFADRLDLHRFSNVQLIGGGVRLAAVVPTPSVLCLVVAWVGSYYNRRQR